MEVSTVVSDVDTPMCKLTQVLRFFNKLPSQYCSRPVEYKTDCAIVVQRNMKVDNVDG
jgi:hypothetical protein